MKRYRDFPIARKFTVFNLPLMVVIIVVLTILVKGIFNATVLGMAQDSYVDKFNTVSDNFIELSEDARQMSNIVLTDERIRTFLYQKDDASYSTRLNLTLQAEEQLDYFDAVRSASSFSYILIYSLTGQMVSTNSIRRQLSAYQQLIADYLQSDTTEKWIDLYASGSEITGIAYVQPYRDYTSGALLGYAVIGYHQEDLLKRIAQLDSGETGSYIIAGADGAVKMSSFPSMPSLSQQRFFLDILAQNAHGIYTVNAIRYQITYSSIQTLDWVMIGLIPVDKLTTRSNTLTGMIYGIAILGILVMVMGNQWIIRGVTRPLANLAKTIQRFGGGQLTAEVPVKGNDEVGMLSLVFNEMAAHIKKLVEQVRKEQRDKRHFQLSALQAQINPHFLYNTLNSVCSLIKLGQTEDSYRIIRSIGTFYRTALSNGKVKIDLREEILNVQSYIEIQRIRYGDKIRYTCDIPDALMDYCIVKFTLQPLVENAIYHGIKLIDGPGDIHILAELQAGKLLVKVVDNGAGMTPEKVEELIDSEAEISMESFGLNNIDRRLKLYFGAEYGLKIDSLSGKGTTVIVILPGEERTESACACINR